MEHDLLSSPASSYGVQFQLSLLRLMYPGAAASTQVAQLEQLRQPAETVLARS
jgi:hypothetical protein